jgi:hypothetical protein
MSMLALSALLPACSPEEKVSLSHLDPPTAAVERSAAAIRSPRTPNAGGRRRGGTRRELISATTGIKHKLGLRTRRSRKAKSHAALILCTVIIFFAFCMADRSDSKRLTVKALRRAPRASVDHFPAGSNEFCACRVGHSPCADLCIR